MKELMDKRELAAALGISVKRIENTINRNQYDKLPPMMLRQSGQKWYWSGRTVEKWLEAQVELSTHTPIPSPTYVENMEKRGRGRPKKVAV